MVSEPLKMRIPASNLNVSTATRSVVALFCVVLALGFALPRDCGSVMADCYDCCATVVEVSDSCGSCCAETEAIPETSPCHCLFEDLEGIEPPVLAHQPTLLFYSPQVLQVLPIDVMLTSNRIASPHPSPIPEPRWRSRTARELFLM